VIAMCVLAFSSKLEDVVNISLGCSTSALLFDLFSLLQPKSQISADPVVMLGWECSLLPFKT
jgi:hypothetical protein